MSSREADAASSAPILRSRSNAKSTPTAAATAMTSPFPSKQKSASPDLFSSPPPNSMAHQLFAQSPVPNTMVDITTSEQHIASNSYSVEEVSDAAPTKNSDGNGGSNHGPDVSLPRNSDSNAPGASEATTDWDPKYDDLVWVQTHPSFPFWPAYICDPAKLPPESQRMATAAIGRRTPTGRFKKYAVYLYASALYDFAKVENMRDYANYREELMKQAVDGTFASLFPQAIVLADAALGGCVATTSTTSGLKLISENISPYHPTENVGEGAWEDDISFGENSSYTHSQAETSFTESVISTSTSFNGSMDLNNVSGVDINNGGNKMISDTPKSPNRLNLNLKIDTILPPQGLITENSDQYELGLGLAHSSGSLPSSPFANRSVPPSPYSAITRSVPPLPQSSPHNVFKTSPPAVCNDAPSIVKSNNSNSDSIFGDTNSNIQLFDRPELGSDASLLFDVPPAATNVFNAASNSSEDLVQIAMVTASAPVVAAAPVVSVAASIVKPRAIFSGRALLATGASPFDAPSSSGPFGTAAMPAAAISGRAQMMVNPMRGVSGAAAATTTAAAPVISTNVMNTIPDSLFGSVIDSVFVSSPSIGSVMGNISRSAVSDHSHPFGGSNFDNNNPFNSPPPAAVNSVNANDIFNHAPSMPVNANYSHIAQAPSSYSGNKSNTQASQSGNDIFSRQAPVTVTSHADPLAPPSAPGVRAKSTSQPSIALAAVPTVARPPNSIGSGAINSSMVQTPPGKIATPHGFVTAVAQASTIINAPSNVQTTTSPSRKDVITTKKETSIPSHLTIPGQVKQPAPAVVDAAPSSHAAVPLVNQIKQDSLWSNNTNKPPQLAAPVVSSTTCGNNNVLNGRSTAGRPVCPAVSFGFGGHLVVMIPVAKQIINPLLITPEDVAKPFKNGPVTICKLNDLLKNNNVYSEEIKLFVSLLNESPATAASNPTDLKEFIGRCLEAPISSQLSDKYYDSLNPAAGKNSRIAAEKLMWALLLALVDHNGCVKSSIGAEDPSSPESSIVRTLLGPSDQHSMANNSVPSITADMKNLYCNFAAPANNSSSSMTNGDMYATIESLLLHGRREEAAQMAADGHDWGLAMLIGSVCGSQKYQEIVRSFAATHFPKTSPLSLIAMMYSSQAKSALAYGGMELLSNTSALTLTPSADKTSLLSMWRRHLAAILSNKGSDWSSLASLLGDRLAAESHDTLSAHFAYICAGALPSPPSSSGGRYTLIGCGVKSSKHRALADVVSISSLRMTEIFEQMIMKSVNSNISKKGSSGLSGNEGITSIGRSIGGLLGLGSSESAKNKQLSAPSNNTAATPSTSPAARNVIEPIAADQLLCVRAALCTFKLRYALVLADWGLLSSASVYASEIKSIIAQCNCVNGAASSTNVNKQQIIDGNTIKPFNQKFVFALDEFIDRLSKHDGSLVSSGKAKGNSNVSIDVGKTGGLWGLGNVFSGMNLKDLVDAPALTAQRGLQRSQSMTEGQYGFAYDSNGSTLQADTNFMGGPDPQMMTQQQAGSGGNEFVNVDLGAADDFNTRGGEYGQQQQQANPLPSQTQQQIMQQQQAPPPQQLSGDQGPGIVDKVRKGLLQFLYPDAHDTSQNMGKGLEAHFDKNTGKWVFPGEETSTATDPSFVPPPTMPSVTSFSASNLSIYSNGSSGSNLVGMDSSGSFNTSAVGLGFETAAASGADSPVYDPLAALMAPPMRSMPKANPNPSVSSSDPLASLMAPPAVNYSRFAAASTTHATTPMPTFNVWKPSAVAAANTNLPQDLGANDSSNAESSPFGDQPLT